MDIYDYSETIKNKKDFDYFLNLLYNEYLKDGKNWENNRLDIFLEALSGSNSYTTDEDAKEEPSWALFAELLLTAIVYE